MFTWGGGSYKDFTYDFAELEDMNYSSPVVKVYPIYTGMILVRVDNTMSIVPLKLN